MDTLRPIEISLHADQPPVKVKSRLIPSIRISNKNLQVQNQRRQLYEVSQEDPSKVSFDYPVLSEQQRQSIQAIMLKPVKQDKKVILLSKKRVGQYVTDVTQQMKQTQQVERDTSKVKQVSQLHQKIKSLLTLNRRVSDPNFGKKKSIQASQLSNLDCISIQEPSTQNQNFIKVNVKFAPKTSRNRIQNLLYSQTEPSDSSIQPRQISHQSIEEVRLLLKNKKIERMKQQQ